MMAKKKSTHGIKVNQCSVCEEFALTIGGQEFGGVRYCRDCIQKTLMWVQTSEQEHKAILDMLDAVSAQPVVQTALEAAKRPTPDERHIKSVGEAGKRLRDSILRGEQ